MKTLRTLFYMTCFSVMFIVPAHAYVDPSVTTFALQAVAAVVVAGGAVIGVLWRKAKKKAMQALNIDENAGKTVEADLQVFDAEAAPAEEAPKAEETTAE